jgi:hypothetical protein
MKVVKRVRTYISLRSILILSTHLRLCLPSGFFPSAFPTNILYALLFSPIRATCLVHLIFLDLIILITLGEEHKLWSSDVFRWKEKIRVRNEMLWEEDDKKLRKKSALMEWSYWTKERWNCSTGHYQKQKWEDLHLCKASLQKHCAEVLTYLGNEIGRCMVDIAVRNISNSNEIRTTSKACFDKFDI